jgi:MFS family permease
VSEPRHAAETRPATFHELLANREFGALFAASAISWIGDFLARAAITALVFTNTKSVVLSATAFAISYLPGLTCGPLLAAMAERYPNRRVMIACDLGRAALISMVAIPSLPTGALLALLFATTLLNAPFDASRSSLLPRILTGEQYVAGVSLQTTTNSIAQVCGYFAGGALAPFYPHTAIVLDAITFLSSAGLIAYGIRPRDPIVTDKSQRKSLIRETAAGFQLVLRSPVLRAIAVLVFGAWMFAAVPEGLAAAWAAHLAHNASSVGVDQAIIMMSVPIGTLIGAVVVGRILAPERRRALIRPLSFLVPLALVPTVLDLPAPGVAVLAGIAGFSVGGLVPPANGLFVQALPSAFRARAFGVMQFGLQLVQAIGIVATSIIAGYIAVPRAVGLWGILGACVMVAAGTLWPSNRRIDDAIAAVRAQNDVEVAPGRGRHAALPSPTAPRQPIRASPGLQPVSPTSETSPTTPGFES